MTPATRVPCPVLETTDYDRATSSLLAILFCLLLLTFTMSFIWFSNLEPTRPATRFFPKIELLGGAPSMTAQSFDVQPPEETSDDPSVQTSPSIAAELFAMVERLGEFEPSEVQEPGIGKGTGSGTASGDGTSDVPAPKSSPERWFFSIDCEEDVDTYATLLEQLDIQLGGFDANGFCYLSRLSDSKPTVRRVSSGKDDRFYTVWQQGTLAALDSELFRRAGVSLSRSDVLHFFGPKLEAQLAQMELEAARANGQKSKDIRRTYFNIAQQRSGSFAISVTKQYFR